MWKRPKEGRKHKSKKDDGVHTKTSAKSAMKNKSKRGGTTMRAKGNSKRTNKEIKAEGRK